ncbi:MAG: hypothetical protein RLY16_2530 [Bacteroidota bacterium]
MKFRSKIGLELVIPITIILGGIGWSMAKDGLWIGFVIVLLIFALFMYVFATTYYVIQNNLLLVRCSFLYYRVIDIHAITKIAETNIPFSAPAASLDRLEVVFAPSQSVVISPKDKKVFMAKILEINPEVIISLKQ